MSDPRPVLLGMNNPYGDRPEMALYPSPANSAGGRLLKFSGLPKRTYLDDFDRRNVITGADWDPAVARLAAPRLRAELAGRTVVVLGNAVNSVMRGGTEHELAPAFRWTPDGSGGWIAKVPHPSGRSTFFNDPLHQHLLAIFMEELLTWHTMTALAVGSPTGSPTITAQNARLGAAQGVLI